MQTLKNIQLLQQLFEFIRPERVDKIAKETGFIQRKRLLTASDFLSLIFHMHGNLVDYSIQELCTTLLSEEDILISRAAVDKKFTPEAVAFLHRLIQEFLVTHQQLAFPALSLSEPWPFTSIRVIDTTMTGKSTKIQFEMDILTGQTTSLAVHFQQMNDVKMGAMRIPFITENELCIQDLGFFHFDHFKKIEGQDGLFLTKVRSDAYLAYQNPFPSYHPNGEVIQSSVYQRIDLVALCEKLAPGECLELENVYFGRDAHFQARCIISVLNDEQKEQRLQKIDRRTIQSRKRPKKIVRDLAGITIYMTNLPEWISARQIIEFYRLRWQVELDFKVWKSYLEIDHFREMKNDRLLCHLYGTILVYLISQLMAFQLRNQIWEEKRMEISEMLAMRSIATAILPKLHRGITKKEKTFKDLILSATQLLIKTARKPKTSKGTAFERLQFV